MSDHIVTTEDIQCMLKCGWTMEQIKQMYSDCTIEDMEELND